MNIPDYSNYSYEELVDILERIEKDKYPEKVDEIEKQIKIKELNTKRVKYFSFSGNSIIQYKSKLFIFIFIGYVSLISLFNTANIITQQTIISIIILPILILGLILIVNNYQKVKLVIQTISVLFLLIGGFSVLAVFFEFIKFLLSTSEEYLFGLNLSKVIPSLIMFGFGLFYFMNVDENVLVKSKSKKVV